MIKDLKENLIREKNKIAVLEYILNNGRVSRANIATHIGINKASVSQIVQNFMDEHLVEEIGIGNSSLLGGRKPVLLQIKKDGCMFLSIDLGFNYIAMMLTFLNGEVIQKHKWKLASVHQETIISVLSKKIRKLLEDPPLTNLGLHAITVGIHGIVSKDTIEFSPFYDLAKLPLKEALQETFHVPVYYENEANLSALANHALNDEYHNLISISIHSGVGSGIIIHNDVYHGDIGFSGEIGHMILFPEGHSCPCGNQGCLETYCSEKAILDTFNQHFNKRLNLSDIKRLYIADDAFTREELRKVAKYLAIGINNLCVMFNPQIIYLNSSLLDSIPTLLYDIKENLNSYMSNYLKIEVSPITADSVLIGGIIYGMKSCLSVEHILLKHMHFYKMLNYEDTYVV